MGYPHYGFDADEFSRINIKRCDTWQKGKVWDLMDWAGCAAGEAGEAQGFGKKIRRMDEDMAQNQVTEDREELIKKYGKELADTVIYCDIAATKAGLNLWDILRDKFNETSERNGFEERV